MSLHPIRDSDIITLLQAVDNRQGLIKAAIRKYMAEIDRNDIINNKKEV
jgi:hypothetical protein